MQWEAMYPGRIDRRMGRATSGATIDLAMRRDRKSQPVDVHAAQVSEALAWLYTPFRRVIPSPTSR